MKNTIKYELSVMVHKKEFLFSLCAMTLFSLVSFMNISDVYKVFLIDRSTVLSPVDVFIGSENAPYSNYFKYVFAFLVVLPYSMSYINDTETGVMPALLTRCSKNQYIASKIIACFIGNVLIIAIPFVFNFILCNIAFPVQGNYCFGEMGLSGYFKTIIGTNVAVNTPYTGIPFLKLFIYSPTLYAILIIIINSVASGVFGAFLLCISFVIKKARPLLFLPLYSLIMAGNIIDAQMYSNSIVANGKYIDFKIMDYFVLSTWYGRSPYFIICVFSIMAVVGIFCLFIGSRGDKMVLSGGGSYDKTGKKNAS